MSLFLSPADVVELTGLRQCAAQRRWLDANEWLYQIDSQGRPKVARSFFERKMTESIAVETQPQSQWNVNVKALRA
jgi:hypothetical protein